MLSQPESVDSIASGVINKQSIVSASAKHPAQLAVYESNLSTLWGTASQSSIDATVPSLGAGLAATEHLLLMMRDLGVTNMNMFALSGIGAHFTGQGSGAGNNSPLWGVVVDMGGTGSRKRPVYLAEAMANSAILPTMLATNQSGANPTWNQPLSTNDNIKMTGAHYIQSFAFTDGTQTNLILFNLHRTAALSVVLNGSNAPTGSATITTLASPSITDNNEQADNVEPTTTSQTLQAGSTVSLPPFSMTVINSLNSLSGVSSIAASCAATTLPAAGSTTCTATVSGTAVTSQGVSWQASQGTISSSGVYTAPRTASANATAIVTATSTQDPTKSGTAAITLASSSINSVSVVCPATSVAAGAKLTCSASVQGVGSFSSGVSWSVSSGTINANGTLTAPSTGSSVTVTAVSQQDTSKSGTATLTVSAASTLPTISAPSISVTKTTAVIRWTTNMPTTNGVSYGTTKLYGHHHAIQLQDHEVTIHYAYESATRQTVLHPDVL